MNWLFDLFWKKEIIFVDFMKYLIVGFGNIGVKYDNIWYNIGFDVVDVLVEKYGGEWVIEKLGDVVMIK